MAAPKGNQYYLIRSKDGREKKYSPQGLVKVANEYFQWCIDNPLQEEVIQKRKISRDEEVIEKHQLSKMRAFSLEGFCNYAQIVVNTFKNYEEDQDFLIVTTRIREIIDKQQFEGAASGFLNANIIARKLGLTDKQEINTKVEQPLFPD